MVSAKEAVEWLQEQFIPRCQYLPEKLSPANIEEICHNPRLVSIVRRNLIAGEDFRHLVNCVEIRNIVEGILEQQRNRRMEAPAVDTFFLQERLGRNGDSTDIMNNINKFIGKGLSQLQKHRIVKVRNGRVRLS